MTWFLVVVAVLVIGAGFVIASRGGVSVPDAQPDRPDFLVPTDRRLTPDDLANVRFGCALFGYRTDEVDALLARLRSELSPPAETGADDPTALPRDDT